jgi:PhnB protein
MSWIESTLAEYPRAAFQDRLRDELERRIRMQAATTKEAVFTAVTPYVTVAEIDRFIEFAKQAFGAAETMRATGSAGGTHCEMRIGDSMLMCGGGPMTKEREKPATLHIYVPDASGAYQAALEAGATAISPVEDKGYAKQGSVWDPTGNRWIIAEHEGPLDEPQRTVTPFLVPETNAVGLIDFIKAAFDAQEMEMYRSQEGKLEYAALRIQDGMLEFGEAPGFPNPAIYLLVANADESYRQAVEAGGKPVYEPADQPYGRMGGVEDAWGNTWYMVSQPAAK